MVGQVEKVAEDLSSFTLRDFLGRMWEINGSNLRGPDLTVVARGGVVRIVGLPVQENLPASATSSVFHACFVFPWEIRGGLGNRQPPPPLAAIASTSEKNTATVRNDVCKNIRPYQRLRSIDESGL